MDVLAAILDVNLDMSSPAKRRKKNDFQPSSQPVRSLDFFFGKQKGAVQRKTEEHNTGNENTEVQPPQLIASIDSGLTDEQLARQLQDEWNNHGTITGDAYHVGDSEPVANPLDNNSNKSFSGSVVIAGTQTAVSGEAVKNEANKKIDTTAKPPTLSLQSVASIEETAVTSLPFDENPLTFDPSKYLPDLKKLWVTEGGDTSYSLLIRCFALVNSTQSRIKIVDTLVNFLRTIIEGDSGSLLAAVSYSIRYPALFMLSFSRFGLPPTLYPLLTFPSS